MYLEHFLIIKYSKGKEKEKRFSKAEIRQKIMPSFYKLGWFTLFFIFNLSCLKGENWKFDKNSYALRPETISKNLKFIYSAEISFYLTYLYFLFKEEIQKDFVMQLVHHLITLYLLFFSYIEKLTRYGIVVMFLHDISDPFLESAKLLIHYGKNKLANYFFIFFTTTFIFCRLVIFPYMVVSVLTKYTYNNYSTVSGVFIGLCAGIVTILFLNIAWSFFILKLLFNILFKGNKVEDTRSRKK